MTRILGRVSGTWNHFQPRTPLEYFALQLARKLGDLEHLKDYLALAQHQPIDTLLRAYRRALKKGNGGLGENFRRELDRLSGEELGI